MKKRALIIDDERDIAKFIGDCLSSMGFQCVFAFRFDDVLEILVEQEIALTVVDVFMAGVGGREGVQKIKTAGSDGPVVAIAAGHHQMNSQLAAQTARRIGADAILSTPLRVSEIRKLVGALVSETDIRDGSDSIHAAE